MKLPCMQCKETFLLGNFVEILYCDEGIYLFCSEECRDNWMSVNAQEIDLESLQQPSL
jgi:hypothetical protein